MKNLESIYQDLRDSFFNKTKIDVERGTVIDYFALSTSEMIEAAYQEIEDNKNPYLYSNLSGSRIDDVAVLCGLTRRSDESDKNFLYRLLKWNTANKASNETAIESALMDMKYASNATHVPHAFGAGTAAVYVIPSEMTDSGKKLALEETKLRLKDVVSPSSYIEYIIPEVVQISLTCLIKASASDITTIKSNISNKIVKYINGIAPGSYMEIGDINKIGNNEPNVTYFNVGHVFINGEETGSVSILQKIESKLLISVTDINWLEVE